MFHPEWADRRGPHPCPSSKKRKVCQKEELKALLSSLPPCPAPDAPDETLVGAIKRQVNDSRSVPAIPEELMLDHVLSSVPYQDMLESLFGGITQDAPSLPLITKAYEESYMREPCPDERPCAMGPKCECMFIDPNAPFVGVEFLLPGETPPGTPHFCVLCSRKVTQKLFYDILLANKDVHGLIQRYGNLCNIPGPRARSLSPEPRALLRPAFTLRPQASTHGSACCSARSTCRCSACPSRSCRTSATSTGSSSTAA